jgi:hypothetical protein
VEEHDLRRHTPGAGLPSPLAQPKVSFPLLTAMASRSLLPGQHQTVEVATMDHDVSDIEKYGESLGIPRSAGGSRLLQKEPRLLETRHQREAGGVRYVSPDAPFVFPMRFAGYRA